MNEEVNHIKKIQAFQNIQIAQLYRDLVEVIDHLGLETEEAPGFFVEPGGKTVPLRTIK